VRAFKERWGLDIGCGALCDIRLVGLCYVLWWGSGVGAGWPHIEQAPVQVARIFCNSRRTA
jgi:hypothetical protein